MLVYHKPGPEGWVVLERFTSSLAALLPGPLEAVEVDESSPRECRGATALLPAPGGHLEHARRAMAPCRPEGPVPAEVSAVALAGALGGCRAAALYYWAAKRLRDAQEAHMERVAVLLGRLAGARVEAAALDFGSRPPPPPGGGWCALAATVAPGRLASALEAAGWRVAASSLLTSPGGFEALLSWAVTAMLGGNGAWAGSGSPSTSTQRA